MVHLERPRPQLAAPTIFSATVVIGLGLVAVQERPFAPPLGVSPAPLEEVFLAIPGHDAGTALQRLVKGGAAC
jgi:hypothetical protein